MKDNAKNIDEIVDFIISKNYNIDNLLIKKNYTVDEYLYDIDFVEFIMELEKDLNITIYDDGIMEYMEGSFIKILYNKLKHKKRNNRLKKLGI